MDHDELVRKYSNDRSKLSPEMRAKVEAATESARRRAASGRVVEVDPADNFPIGLDDNYNPFPTSRKRADSRDADDSADASGNDQ